MTTSDAVRVGRFHTGRIHDGRPQALDAWRVTTDIERVATGVASLMGGQPTACASGDHSLEVLTEHESVRIIMDQPGAVQAHMVLWRQNKRVHHCDGIEFLTPEDKEGQPCGCPSLFAERRAAARSGTGPMPSTDLVFRLAADPALGEFHLPTSSWQMAEQSAELQADLSRVEGQAVCDLTLEMVLLTTRKGMLVSYHKPVVTVLGSPDTVAPEPPRIAPSAPVPVVVPSTGPAAHRNRSNGDRNIAHPSPSVPSTTPLVGVDTELMARAARILGTDSDQETVAAALSSVLKNQQQAVEFNRLREDLHRIAVITEHALQTDNDNKP
ncbi:hypothetical protein C8250_008945 [Streptomyces sp. So13.3]|uniref:recombination directionality factor n=1 Tax=Streptomyces sp. So13.3 TaxID=2136173 RepID=UPI0011073684|nr:hypothetical protein [Streptomyces sp. So13.3]QNA72011.1 hypothetical protein C8250_008945 [Streptomyces sp. So13.3]